MLNVKVNKNPDDAEKYLALEKVPENQAEIKEPKTTIIGSTKHYNNLTAETLELKNGLIKVELKS